MADFGRQQQWEAFARRYPFAEDLLRSDHFRSWLEDNPRMQRLSKSILCADATEVVESYRMQYPERFDDAVFRYQISGRSGRAAGDANPHKPARGKSPRRKLLLVA